MFAIDMVSLTDVYSDDRFDANTVKIGTKVTYQDALGRDYSVLFTGPNNDERCRAYMNVLISCGAREVNFVSDSDAEKIIKADDGGWLNLGDQSQYVPAN